ncbi:MAG: type I glutamate--ammonia ligase [Rhodospirillales bacterium]|jgi:glutamine synthetase|nr:type I glutamate--ammonia ligase [Rhodospirillaceae bacterium]MDP6429229.1 type I glutamate--ammonia ligase [Rhodospirillales bacterium]MDP6645516.1 type I glutamate--ammonia ligase [Rhodospirillales bacterium]MDP6843010.1 type I glutamate--ammonia ligase [Rhodospirillales bacterium]|tara:strand:+ start:886 stop:2307 length:1422 start_codon:yes stop_codon:yes gene_type:complete
MSLNCKSPEDVAKAIAENDVRHVDLRFTDPRGKWQHLTQVPETIDDNAYADGIFFDGSSIAGWRGIHESDMALIPDPVTAVMDPFAQQPTMILVCDVHDPVTGEQYSRDPRSTAKRAEAYLKGTGIGDTAYFGPEAEFFVFDDVRYDVSMDHTFYKIDHEEGPYNTGAEFADGNIGHRPPVKGGYFPVPPVDSMHDLRSEMVSTMQDMGVTMEKHHHEVAPSQNELGIKFDTLVRCADNMQIYKYVVHMVSHIYGKTATFMPKPVLDDNGSGMHVHQSIWKEGSPSFAGSGYADLSETALHYIGGMMKHAKALNAFSNPTTNSYKRLIPGFEAPVLLAYSARNRSAGCRIPYSASPGGKRVEVRFPDGTANTYLTFATMLMAGLDGIQNKIDPGDAMDKDLYDLPPEELAGVPTVCGSLREALDSLDADRDFLKAGDVFSDDLIDGYIELRTEEVYAVEQTPHPVEFAMYYSA